MHRTSFDALEKSEPKRHPLVLRDELASLSFSATGGADQLREAPALTKTGAPCKRSAEAVTTQAAQTYKKLTGKKPRPHANGNQAGGPFLRFLGEIFAILEIKASPEGQIKRHGKNSP